MADYTMTIDGGAVPVTSTFDVINPSTGKVLAQAPRCSKAQLDQAVESAAKAFRDWRADEAARRDALRKVAGVIAGSLTELATLLSTEQGKPVGSTAMGDATFEIMGCGLWFQYHADLEMPREVIQDDAAARVEVLRRPLGVVAAITPWNFPALLACWKIAPALLAGNTMVLKPSPFTPLTTLRLGELIAGVLPPGVLNVVSGDDELGAWMTSHPTVRKISFTGSVATGKKVAASAAPDLKRVTLELGGNDPAILLDDVDPGAVAEQLFWSAFSNCGQICSAIKRVYVPEPLYDDVVEALVEQARAARVGDGLAEGTQIGPINNRPQYERVGELVADAIKGGARAAVGGKALPGDGYFFEPTILADVSDGTRIVDEEQFGPALPVISYRNLDEAVERANATHFGLSGSVWSADPARAGEVAARLECGTAWANTHLMLSPNQPFGGAKWSGIGVENGPWGLLGFTELQVLYQAKG
ncbi:MAG: aldehyde dehydrogenase family protein [Acidimicrobiia bacterium]